MLSYDNNVSNKCSVFILKEVVIMVKELVKAIGNPSLNPVLGIITDVAYIKDGKDGKDHKLKLQLLEFTGNPELDVTDFSYSQRNVSRLRKVEKSLLDLFNVSTLNKLVGKGARIDRDDNGTITSFNALV